MRGACSRRARTRAPAAWQSRPRPGHAAQRRARSWAECAAWSTGSAASAALPLLRRRRLAASGRASGGRRSKYRPGPHPSPRPPPGRGRDGAAVGARPRTAAGPGQRARARGPAPDSAIWAQNCFLNVHTWQLVASVLYMNWLKMFSLTMRASISRNACRPARRRVGAQAGRMAAGRRQDGGLAQRQCHSAGGGRMCMPARRPQACADPHVRRTQPGRAGARARLQAQLAVRVGLQAAVGRAAALLKVRDGQVRLAPEARAVDLVRLAVRAVAGLLLHQPHLRAHARGAWPPRAALALLAGYAQGARASAMHGCGVCTMVCISCACGCRASRGRGGGPEARRARARACGQMGTMTGVWKLRWRRRVSGALSSSRFIMRISCIMRSSAAPAQRRSAARQAVPSKRAARRLAAAPSALDGVRPG